jgi:nucleotide-binding universal stress UspA family protein
MFKHILLPTDGSERSEAAIQKGIQFAKSINAKVTGFHVLLPFHVFTFQTEMLEDTKEQFERDAKAHAERFLDVITKAAEAAGVSLRPIMCSQVILMTQLSKPPRKRDAISS